MPSPLPRSRSSSACATRRIRGAGPTRRFSASRMAMARAPSQCQCCAAPTVPLPRRCAPVASSRPSQRAEQPRPHQTATPTHRCDLPSSIRSTRVPQPSTRRHRDQMPPLRPLEADPSGTLILAPSGTSQRTRRAFNRALATRAAPATRAGTTPRTIRTRRWGLGALAVGSSASHRRLWQRTAASM